MAKTLADIPLSRVAQVQQRALLRQHLYLTGETHRLLWQAGQMMKAAIVGAAKADGQLDGLGLHRARTANDQIWATFMTNWKHLVQQVREQSAMLPFGTLAVYQAKLLRPALASLRIAHSETIPPKDGDYSMPPNDGHYSVEQNETAADAVFNPQLQRIVDAADRRIYQDGLKLSQRIWNLDRESLAGIEDLINVGVANGASAWDIAEQLEQYLGASQDCPRWTSTRLRLTKTDIAEGNRAGLIRGGECAGQGVAYKALRLARNELQAIHHLATDTVLQEMPWVEKEQVVLSPAHPVDDECDDVIAEGEGGEGIYPVGTIELPIHIQCLCFKVAIQMAEDEFVASLRGWADGSEPWPAMDTFADRLGGNALLDLTTSQIAQHLPEWAFEDPASFLGD